MMPVSLSPSLCLFVRGGACRGVDSADCLTVELFVVRKAGELQKRRGSKIQESEIQKRRGRLRQGAGPSGGLFCI